MKRVLLPTLLALPASAVLADPVPLNLSTGEWEYTVTMRMAGMPQLGSMTIPEEQLAKLPPQQRAKMEAALKQAADVTAGKPTVSRNCVKKEDLTRLNPMGETASSCKLALIDSSSAKLVFTTTCDAPGNKTKTEITIEALSSTESRFHATTTGAMNGKPMNMTIDGAGRWLAAQCLEKK
ncbi:MAG TPA: DUF3617 domain-containing protein [Methylocystis sp.]|nr:DUF3617 domain-containing protein [Methylocystis sp.]